MALLSAIFSLLSKKIGDLLQAVFGWSITGLFGKLPPGKQTALTVALVLSLVWPMLVVGVFVPGIAAWAVAFVPLQHWIGHTALRITWTVLAVVAPLIVGVITHAVVPSARRKGGFVQVVLSGLPLTLGFAIAFLITLLVVPALKIAAMARRWNDEHVFVQVKPGAYRDVLAAVARACEHEGVAVAEKPVPAPMRAPTRVLQWFARGALSPVVAEDPRMLVGKGVELYLYPADLLLRGGKVTTARIRAALVRELIRAPAHLTQDPRAQHIETELDRMWAVVERHGGAPAVRARGDKSAAGDLAEPIHEAGFSRLREIDEELKSAHVPYEDWVLLYTNLLRLDRAMTGAAPAVQPEPEPEGAATRSTATHADAMGRDHGLFALTPSRPSQPA